MSLNHPETFPTPTPVHGKKCLLQNPGAEMLETAAIKKKKKIPGMQRGRKPGSTRVIGENQSIKPKPEMAWITEFVVKDILKAIITVFYVFKKLEKKLAR